LFHTIKRELNYLINNAAKIGTAAFLCCFGGILLWVDGTNLWCVMRSGRLPRGSMPVTGMFLLWLLAYGLCGMLLGLILLQSREPCFRKGRGDARLLLTAFAAGCTLYLLMLTWYAVFFCTHLVLFALVLLLTALLLTLTMFLLLRRGLLLFRIVLLLITLVEFYFIYFNFTFCLG